MVSSIKGQFWSFDVIFAVIIFSFAITILAFTWSSINNSLSISNGNGAGLMQAQLQAMMQSVMSPGSPGNWQGAVNTTNPGSWQMVSAGLLESNGSMQLDPSKVYALQSMSNYDYQASKQALGVGFDYYITIKGSDNYGSGINITMGRNPEDFRALTIYTDSAFSSLDERPVVVRAMVWTNTTLGLS